MARWCPKCGQPIEDHDGRGEFRVCPISPVTPKYDPEKPNAPRRFRFDPGKTDRKQRAKRQAVAEHAELEGLRIAEAEKQMKELEQGS